MITFTHELWSIFGRQIILQRHQDSSLVPITVEVGEPEPGPDALAHLGDLVALGKRLRGALRVDPAHDELGPPQ